MQTFQRALDIQWLNNRMEDGRMGRYLAVEVAKVRREESCALLRRHYLRERDPGLRQLATKLQAGYVEERQANSVLLNALYNDEEAKEHEDRQKMERTTQYKRDLQVQLVNRQRERQCVYEDSLERTCREMATSQRARAAWKDKQKEMVIKEEREVAERERKMREKDELCERISAKIMADEIYYELIANLQNF
ncbi:putative Myosin heavy chain, cardiac muscle alpha isoform, partial [Operophtera brumata]